MPDIFDTLEEPASKDIFDTLEEPAPVPRTGLRPFAPLPDRSQIPISVPGWESAEGAEPALREAEAASKAAFGVPWRERREMPLVNVSPGPLLKAAQVFNPALAALSAASPAARQFQEGAAETLAGAATGMSSPENLATLPAFAVPVVGQALMAEMGAEQLGSGAGAGVEALRQGDPRLAGQAAAELGLGASMAVPGIRSVVGRRPATPPPIPESEVAKYASENRTPETVYGPLRTQPVEGVREVPTEISGERVQPQTEPPKEALPPAGKVLTAELDKHINSPESAARSTDEAVKLGDQFKTAEEKAALQEWHDEVVKTAREKIAAKESPTTWLMKKHFAEEVLEASKGLKEKELATDLLKKQQTEFTGDTKAAFETLQGVVEKPDQFSTANAYDLGDRFKTPEDIAALKQWVEKAKAQLREKTKVPAKTPEELTAKEPLVALIQKLDEVVQGAEKPTDRPAVQEHFAKKPDPNWRVVVQGPEGESKGYFQIVDPKATSEAVQSPTAESLKAAGVDVPDFSKLPQGTYTYAEAVAKLAEQKPESKGTLIFKGVQMGVPKYGMVNPKTGRMIQYTAEEARKKGFEVSPGEEAKGRSAIMGSKEVTVKAKTPNGQDLNVKMNAREAESIFTKRKSAFESLLDCLGK